MFLFRQTPDQLRCAGYVLAAGYSAHYTLRYILQQVGGRCCCSWCVQPLACSCPRT